MLSSRYINSTMDGVGHSEFRTLDQTPRGQELLGHTKDWQIKMMAVFFFVPIVMFTVAIFQQAVQSSLPISSFMKRV